MRRTIEGSFLRKSAGRVCQTARPFCRIVIDELPDEPLTNVKGEKAEEAVRAAEGERILRRCEGYVVACDVRGKEMSSEAFAEKLGSLMSGGSSTLTFVIGGSLGLSAGVLGRADLQLSLSRMTLPHRLFRIVLLEQIFRAFKIMHGETYHK